jgi:hypothetical protein
MGRDSTILQRMIIDLQAGKEQQRVEPVPRSGLHFSYWPLEGNRLLGEGRSYDTATTEVIVLAELPDYREIKRMPFSRENARTIARRDDLADMGEFCQLGPCAPSEGLRFAVAGERCGQTLPVGAASHRAVSLQGRRGRCSRGSAG